MAATAAAYPRHAVPSCPFCSFCVSSSDEKDMYALVHHLEMNHPENGSSPFATREEGSIGCRSRSKSHTRSLSGSSRERSSRSHSITPSLEGITEDVYVECPVDCGEAVHIRELEDHMELHDIEELAFEGPSRPSSSRNTSPRPPDRKSLSLEHTLGPDSLATGNSSRLAVPRVQRPLDRKSKDYSLFGGLKQLLLGPAPRRTRPTLPNATSGIAKRLGVCLCVYKVIWC